MGCLSFVAINSLVIARDLILPGHIMSNSSYLARFSDRGCCCRLGLSQHPIQLRRLVTLLPNWHNQMRSCSMQTDLCGCVQVGRVAQGLRCDAVGLPCCNGPPASWSSPEAGTGPSLLICKDAARLEFSLSVPVPVKLRPPLVAVEKRFCGFLLRLDDQTRTRGPDTWLCCIPVACINTAAEHFRCRRSGVKQRAMTRRMDK